MSWPLVSIKECARIVSGATPKSAVSDYWDGDLAWVTPKDLANLGSKYIEDTPRKITQAGLQSCSAEMLPPGSVLFSSRAPIGHVAINTIPMATNQGFKSMVPEPCLDPSYLYWWLRAHRQDLENLGNGATFKEVSKAVVERVEIPLPPLEEQKRIAAILDQADSLRRLRQRAIDRLNALGQAIFYEMFGDPVANPKQWPTKKIADVAKVITGNTPSRQVPGYFGSDVEWIKSDNINTPYYYLTKAEEGLSEAGRRVARIAPSGSILVTCIAGSPECIGNSAMTDRDVAFNQQINALVPSDGDVHFIYAQLRAGKRLVQNASSASMKGMVSKSRFESIVLIWPPLPLQQKFSERIQALEQSGMSYRAAIVRLNALFTSLQHRAFRGEL